MYDGNPRDAADEVAGLEKAGLDTVWVAEAYGFDSPTLMGYLAAKTETVEIGVGDPQHLLAHARRCSRRPRPASTTSRGGRAVLGLGASGPAGDRGLARRALRQAARPHPRGRRHRPQGAAPREARARRHHQAPAARGGQGTGLGKPLKMLTKPERDTDPDLDRLARPQERRARPRSTPTAGCRTSSPPRVADKVWGDALAQGHGEALRRARPAAGRGRRHGRDRRGRQGHARLRAPDVRALHRRHGRHAARTSTTTWPAQYGYEQEAEQIQDLYLDGKKDEAAAAVPAELLELCNLVGPESYVKERIEAFRESGVTHLNVIPATEDPVGHHRPAQGVDQLMPRHDAATSSRPSTRTSAGPSAPSSSKEVDPHHEQWETRRRRRPRAVAQGRRGRAALLRRRPRSTAAPGVTRLPLQPVVLAEEQTRAGANGPGFSVHTDIIVPYLISLGTEEQKQRWLPGCVSGRDDHRDRDDRARARAATCRASGRPPSTRATTTSSTARRPSSATASCPTW